MAKTEINLKCKNKQNGKNVADRTEKRTEKTAMLSTQQRVAAALLRFHRSNFFRRRTGRRWHGKRRRRRRRAIDSRHLRMSLQQCTTFLVAT